MQFVLKSLVVMDSYEDNLYLIRKKIVDSYKDGQFGKINVEPNGYY